MSWIWAKWRIKRAEGIKMLGPHEHVARAFGERMAQFLSIIPQNDPKKSCALKEQNREGFLFIKVQTRLRIDSCENTLIFCHSLSSLFEVGTPSDFG